MPITANNLHKSTTIPWVYNEDGVDCDFRIESDTNTHAFFLDAGNSRVGINNSAPTTALDVTGAITASGAITSGGAFTVTAGGQTITAGDLTVTAGDVTITAGDLNLTAASDVVIAANTAAALEVSDGTTKLLAFDSRNTVAVQNVVFTAPGAQTLPNGATSRWRHLSLAAHTVTLAGQTQVTTANQGAQLYIGAPTYAQSGGAVTVDQVSTVHIEAPVAGSSVTITANRMISTSVSDCYLTGAGVWTDTASTQKVKQDIADLDREQMFALLQQIRPVSYRYDPEKLGAYDLDRDRYGIIAEELPECLRVPGEVNPSGLSGVILGAFSLAANRCLLDEVTALRAELAALKPGKRTH